MLDFVPFGMSIECFYQYNWYHISYLVTMDTHISRGKNFTYPPPPPVLAPLSVFSNHSLNIVHQKRLAY